MIKQESNRAVICLLLSVACFAGLPIFVALHGLEEDDDSLLTLVTVPGLLLGCFGFWVLTTVFLARAKGYSGAVGLFGLLWVLGVIVLIALPDKAKRADKDSQDGPAKRGQ